MRRPAAVLLTAALLSGAAMPTAGAAGAPRVAPSSRALARVSFAAFRRPARPSDRVSVALMQDAQRARLRGALTRRVARGAGWAAFVALERHRGVYDTELLVAGTDVLAEGQAVLGTVRQFATHGASITFTTAHDGRMTVTLVPDGARAAWLQAKGSPGTPLAIRGNALVAPTPGAATITWRMPGGRSEDAAVGVPQPSGTRVSAQLLDGSALTVDTGDGAVHIVPLSGGIGGLIAGGYQLDQDNTITLDKGGVQVAQSDLLSDACAAPAIARTVGAAQIALDPADPGSVLVARDGTVTATVHGILRSAFLLRQSNGCGMPAVPSGQTDTPLSLRLTGRLQRGTGLTRVELASDPTPEALQVCLVPGDPTGPCASPTTVASTVTAALTLKVRVGS